LGGQALLAEWEMFRVGSGDRLRRGRRCLLVAVLSGGDVTWKGIGRAGGTNPPAEARISSRVPLRAQLSRRPRRNRTRPAEVSRPFDDEVLFLQTDALNELKMGTLRSIVRAAG
jgi:hypothetical protein